MKVRLKHVLAYLPYELRFTTKSRNNWFTLISVNINTYAVNLNYEEMFLLSDVIPILRPMGDLLKEKHNHLKQTIIINSSKTVFEEIVKGGYGINHLPYYVVELLLEKHFDIFNLIREGLAEDENTINYGS